MDLLFIDANIYLRFYDSSQPEYKRLLKTLLEVKDSVFITEQVVNEVNRMKLSVFRTSCNEPVADNLPRRTHLPEHLDAAGQQTIKVWNKKKKELNDKSEILAKEQAQIYGDLLSAISASTDTVSKEMSAIFSKAKSPSPDQINRAIHRKRIGNPPGKPQDPLGDQLSWEQLLGETSKATAIWIISNDQDYFSSFKDVCYLNPFLASEIRNTTKLGVPLKCFDRLSLGLKDFNDHLTTKLKTLPEQKELETISNLERIPSLTGYANGSVGTVPTYSGIQNLTLMSRAVECPICHNADRIRGPIITVQGTDGFLFTYVCQSCGNQWSDGRQ